MVGKVPLDILKKYIFTRIGVRDPDVIIGPKYGEDSAIINLDDKVLVVHVDPITGAIEWLGWLAVHIASNDIAVTGAKPRWLLDVLYLPENAPEDLIDKLTSQIDEAAKEIGAMIVGGHSEYTPGLRRPIISMTAMGVVPRNKYVTTAGVNPGDVIIMTKTAAIEGTAILATDFREILLEKGVGEDIIRKASRFMKMVSVVKEALKLAELGVHAMHDPTEGGILGGLAEMAYASEVLIEVWEDKIPIAEETKILCEALNIDPLKLISSGVLLAALPKDKVEEALNELRRLGIRAEVIGLASKGKGVILHRTSGEKEVVEEYVPDELFRLWKELEIKHD